MHRKGDSFTFTGNTNIGDTQVWHRFSNPVTTQYVKFIPLSWEPPYLNASWASDLTTDIADWEGESLLRLRAPMHAWGSLNERDPWVSYVIEQFGRG